MQDDAKVEISKQMKRVIVLRFECDTARYFFWLQVRRNIRVGDVTIDDLTTPC